MTGIFTDEELQPFGYAPGGYMVKCSCCKLVVMGMDKRATVCVDCATTAKVRTMRELIKEAADYLDTNRLTNIAHGSILHQKFKEVSP